MTITIADVIEQCAQTAEGFDACDPKYVAAAIRVLAAQYEGCIVADGGAIGSAQLFRGHLVNCDVDADHLPLNGKSIPLYRARETQR